MTISTLAELNLPARMERLPLTWYQRRIFLIIATAWLFDSLDLAMMTFLLASISRDFALTPAQSGILGSASLAGMFFGAALAGMLADRFGRKVIFQSSMLVWGLASFMCGLSWSFKALLVFRFILGFGMAAEFPIAQSLVSEFIPARQRGKYIAMLEGFWPVGFILAGVLAILLLAKIGWHGVFIIEGLPAIWVLIIRRRVPESPRWLAARGRFEEAQSTMQQVEAAVEASTGSPLPAPSLKEMPEESVSKGFSLWDLFGPDYRRRTLMIWLLWFCVLLGYYSITTWMGKLLVDHGFSVQKSNNFVVIMAVFGLPGFYSAAWLVEKIGRKACVVLYLIMSAGAAYFYGQAASNFELIWRGALMQFFFYGMWSALYAYTPELFPTRARATACGTASALGRLGGLLGPVLVPPVIAWAGMPAVFLLAGAAFGIGALSVIVFGPETRGRVLEEIAR